MKLNREEEVLVHCGDQMRNVTLDADTELSTQYLHGEKIVLVEDGRWKGWCFIACERWLRNNTH